MPLKATPRLQEIWNTILISPFWSSKVFLSEIAMNLPPAHVAGCKYFWKRKIFIFLFHLSKFKFVQKPSEIHVFLLWQFKSVFWLTMHDFYCCKD
jgi:hypothetical protein